VSGAFDPRREAHLLSAYVDGELDAHDVARIEAHLAADAESRREVEQLRRLKGVTGALRLREPPPEVWEDFWRSAYNRGERSLGWLLLGLAVLVVGGWGVTELLQDLLGTESLPLLVKGAVIGGGAGLVLLVVSVVRERIHVRGRTRYKDVKR
jgi:anti-sigma factor RsiW